jgi:membrane protein implicated in regulation of membrane protease activity
VNRIAALGKPTLVLAGLLLLVGTVLNTFVMPSKFSEAALTPLFEVSAALVLASSMLLVLSLVALLGRRLRYRRHRGHPTAAHRRPRRTRADGHDVRG